jgi:hypothetical protein
MKIMLFALHLFSHDYINTADAASDNINEQQKDFEINYRCMIFHFSLSSS